MKRVCTNNSVFQTLKQLSGSDRQISSLVGNAINGLARMNDEELNRTCKSTFIISGKRAITIDVKGVILVCLISSTEVEAVRIYSSSIAA